MFATTMTSKANDESALKTRSIAPDDLRDATSAPDRTLPYFFSARTAETTRDTVISDVAPRSAKRFRTKMYHHRSYACASFPRRRRPASWFC